MLMDGTITISWLHVFSYYTCGVRFRKRVLLLLVDGRCYSCSFRVTLLSGQKFGGDWVCCDGLVLRTGYIQGSYAWEPLPAEFS